MSVRNLFPMDSAPATPGPNDTQSLRALTPEGYELSVLVVANDPAVIESVRSIAPRTVTVLHSPRTGKLTALVEQFHPSVLVYESDDVAQVGSLTSQLGKKYPTVPMVVVGKRDHGPQLMRLVASGAICRFLLLPLITGQTRLALMAALRQHVALRTSAPQETPVAQGLQRKHVIVIAGCGLAITLALGAMFFGLHNAKQKPTVSAVSPATTPVPTSPVETRLQQAQEAFQQGRLVRPQGENALALYRSVLALEPDNETARRGMRAIADRILESAEANLTREDLESAVRDIETVRDIDAVHPRLAFFDTQIARERERLKLTQMRDVSAQVQRLLTLVSERIQTGRLIAPNGASARDALLEARRLDPSNPEIAAAVRELSAALVERGRKALGERDLTQARQLAQAAENLGSTSASVAALQRAITDISQQLATRQAAATSASASASASGTSTGTAANPSVDSRTRETDTGSAGSNAAPERNHAFEAPAQPTMVQALQIRRVREVQPIYPNRAVISGAEGWVEMEFIITPSGIPEQIKVTDARPRRVFDQAATTALSQWRFEPVTHNGQAVAQPARLRMTFKLQ